MERNIYEKKLLQVQAEVNKIIKGKQDIEAALKLQNQTDYLLLDAYGKEAYGGTGETFRHELIPKDMPPYFLAGGIGVDNVVEMLDQGDTVPFIARYRKERTGGLSDEVLRKLSERLTYLRNLEERKNDVSRLIEEQGKLTEEIIISLQKAETLTEVEDIYRPYKPKKRTRATMIQRFIRSPHHELL
mgnify:CR=1 FL=1